MQLSYVTSSSACYLPRETQYVFFALTSFGMSYLNNIQTACALTYITYFLALHQDVMSKLRAEIVQHCGLTEAPTFDRLKDMRYRKLVTFFSGYKPPLIINHLSYIQ